MIVKAESEGFIWLIVGAFWVIAQIAGAAAKKKRQSAAEEAGSEESRPADPFAELLRKIAGAQEFRVEPPDVEEEPCEDLSAAFRSPWMPGEIESLPDLQPLQRAAQTQGGLYPAAVNLNPSEKPQVDIQPKMSTFRSSLSPIKQPSMNFSFTGPSSETRSRGDSSGLRSILHPADKTSLRRAMLGHILLGKPKALQPSGFGHE